MGWDRVRKRGEVEVGVGFGVWARLGWGGIG